MTTFKNNTFCWVDTGTTNLKKAKDFYGKLFSWTFKDSDMGDMGVYAHAQLNGKDVGGLYELTTEMKDKHKVPSHWMSYVMVDNVDTYTKKAKDLGATPCGEAWNVGDFGRMCVITDQTKATLAVWQSTGKHEGEMAVMGTPGTFCWNELLTSNTDVAGKFYTNLFKWTPKVQTFGTEKYTTFMIGETMVGGMMQKQDKNMPSFWNVYFSVTDCDATVKKAKDLGAKIFMGPENIPTVGRFAVLQDTCGATFSVITLEKKM